MLSDYEPALMGGLAVIFPTAQIVGCWFHYAQATSKYMSGLGLKEQYSKNPGFAKWFKMVLALSLLPTERITTMWNELKADPIPNAEYIPRIPNKALQKLKKYVENTWIIGKINVLSVFGQENRTNNHSEVYNKKWNSRVQVKNPNMWKLYKKIYDAFVDAQKDMGRLDNNLTITRPRARKNVLNTQRLRVAEEKLGTTYTSRDFLKAVTHSFNLTNAKYFEEWALEDNDMLAESSDSNDSDEGENAPELYQDESDDEIQLQPQQGAQNTRPACVVCMDREPQVVLVPCGHQNLCAPCAYQWKEENGHCPTDRREIEIIVTTIPL